METTSEERRKWMQWTLDNGDWRLKDMDTDFVRRVIRDVSRLERAARDLLSRKDDGPSEDAHIFAEWDDLWDALD